MSQKMIEVTKANGSKHIVPAKNIKKYKAHNTKFAKHPRFKEEHELKWEEVDTTGEVAKTKTKGKNVNQPNKEVDTTGEV